MKSKDQVIAQYGERNVAVAIMLAVNFGNALNLHPGQVMQLLSKATPEELANVKTARQALALVMAQYTKKLDDAFIKAEQDEGSAGPELDLSCAKDLYEAANGEEVTGPHAIDRAQLVPGTGTLQ